MQNNTKIQITQQGLDSLKIELEELLNTKRPQLVERLERARGEGDLSENADYINGKEELEFLDGRIDELKHVVENADVVVDSNGNKSISLGNSVVVRINGAEHEFYIVGNWEANPAEKKISHESPLGQQLIGRKVGESVEVEAPAGKIVYEIVDIKSKSA